MNLEKIVVHQVKYKISDIVVYCGSTTFQVPSEMFTNIYIEKDYDNMAFPFFQLSLKLPTWLYRQMQRDSQNIRVGFNLKYGLFDNVKKFDTNMITELSGKFYALIGDSGVSGNEDKYVEIERQSKQYEKGYTFNELANVDMLLFNEQYYLTKDKTSNIVFTSATPMEALTYVLNQAGYSNVLVSPASNNKSYSQFKLPPLGTIDQIKRLCQTYNLHSLGSVIFFDLDRGYIVDKQAKCTAWVPNEYRTTKLMTLSNYQRDSAIMSGIYVDKEEKTNNVILSEGSYSFNNLSNTETISSIKVINTSTGSISNVGVNNSGKGSVTYTYSGGTDRSSQIARQIEENQSILTINTDSCRLGILTPNKTFNVSIDNSKARLTNINGIYRLSKYVCNLAQEGDYLIPSVVATFKK